MEALIQSLAAWSYLLIFGLVFFEALGMPLPGYSVALIAAALAGHGQLSIWIVVPVTLVAAVTGGMVGYTVGAKGGRTFIERYGRYAFITPRRFQSAEYYFHKHGDKAVLLGRYLPFLCFLAGVLAGIARLPYRKFLVANLIGAILWCSSHLTLGFVFGRSLQVVLDTFNNVFQVGAVLAVVLFIGFMVRRKLRTRAPARPMQLSRPLQITLDEPKER